MKQLLPWHSLLICLYLVLFLFAQNTAFLDWGELWTPLWHVLALGILIYALCYAIFRHHQKAGLLASLLALIGLSFGFYRDAFYGTHLGPIRVDHNFYKWSALILVLFVSWRLWKRKSALRQLTRILNFSSLVLLLLTAAPLLRSAGSSAPARHGDKAVGQSGTGPSIYYFIMDAYGREDVLKELYDFDNSAFMDSLRNRGFYIADSSFSNYNKTVLSIPSSLEMDYLDSIIAQEGVDGTDQEPLLRMIDRNATVDRLRARGYRILASDGPVLKYLYMSEADHFSETPGADINAFEHALINQSIYRAFVRKSTASNQDGFDHHRKKILHAFEHARQASELEGSHYVHAHILSPHQPFVFDRNGAPVEPEHEYTCWYPVEDGRDPVAYRTAYIEQLQFVNDQLLRTIDHILEHSAQPPIILIQGDHGPCAELTNTKSIAGNNFHERMPILNAYHLPDGDTTGLYPGISPVNSFRFLFNRYFGADLPLLPDRSYYSTWDRVYDMVDVTDSVN